MCKSCEVSLPTDEPGIIVFTPISLYPHAQIWKEANREEFYLAIGNEISQEIYFCPYCGRRLGTV